MKKWFPWGAGLLAGTLAAATVIWLMLAPERGDPALAAFVHQRPPVPVVFTSRTTSASLEAAAAEGEGFHFPGQPLWQAGEGRLRLLTPNGQVRELTWGQPLPDGGTLIDVMSPSVSPDARRIVFAGRQAAGHGRFRLYEVRVDGHGLRQLTGLADDPGCTALPPLRFAADGTLLPPAQRRAIDYDDVDPVYLPDGRIVFASSRTPDLGRGHARRATNLWVLAADGRSCQPITANRNNDRWPYLMSSSFLAFSLWSRNTEVITADERDVRPWEPGLAAATAPTDSWLGAVIEPTGDRFGFVIKTAEPVWRPRPLFNGRLTFMTPGESPDDPHTLPRLRVAQAEAGLITNVPSARPIDQPLPRQASRPVFGPERDAAGRRLSLATPSPCPDRHILLAGAVLEESQPTPPQRMGLYLMDDDWQPDARGLVTAEQVGLRLLFDDPNYVDAEPVAVYPRPVPGSWQPVPARRSPDASAVVLADGRPYLGEVGQVVNGNLFFRQHEQMPGLETDTGERPLFDVPPRDAIRRIHVYASHRDRFDDPEQPRVPGSWELLLQVPLTNGQGFDAWMPAGTPTVLAGFGDEGRVVRWTTAPRDSQGRQATFYALAGDHYSGTRAGMYHFCLGCHPGHSHLGLRQHPESLRSKPGARGASAP